MNSKYKWKGGERLMRPAKETAWNLAVRNDICCKELFPGSDIVRSYTFKTAIFRLGRITRPKRNEWYPVQSKRSAQGIFMPKFDCSKDALHIE